MASQQDDGDDGMDQFMDQFKNIKYKNAFNESNWEEEFDKVPMFTKAVPEVIDPKTHPDLACIQAIIHDDDRTPDEKAKSLKDEGNAYFKEKNYSKAVVSYTAGLKVKCTDQEVNTILLTNRAAAHFHLGNMRSALNDSIAAKKLRPDHLKALIRGAQCYLELRCYSDALCWCVEALQLYPADRKLQELRCSADRQQRAAERDARKARLKAKKERVHTQALLDAIQNRGVKLLQSEASPKPSSDSEEEEDSASSSLAALHLGELSCQEATGSQVFLDEQGVLHWPVLFLYPEHQQTDFISAFCEESCFIDHLGEMFGVELPPWDTDRKYLPQNLQMFFEDSERETFHQVDLTAPLRNVLQNDRCFVKAGTPSFIVMVKESPFSMKFLSGRKVHRLR